VKEQKRCWLDRGRHVDWRFSPPVYWSLCCFLLLPASGLSFQNRPATAAEAQSQLPVLLKQAQEAFARGNFLRSAENFRAAAKLSPNNPRIYLVLGIALMNAGEHAESNAALAKANTLRPHDFETVLALAQVGTLLKNYDASQKHLAEAARMRPAAPQVALLSVQLHASSGQLDGLKEALRTTARAFSENGKLHAQIAQWLFDLRKEELDDLALSAFLRAEQSGHLDAGVRLSLASLESRMGAFEDAVQNASWVIEQAQVSRQRKAAAAAVAGESCASLGQQDRAVQYLQMAVELDPHVEEYYMGLARVHRNRKDYTAAAQVLTAGRKSFPLSRLLWQSLGTDLLAAKDYRAAASVLAALVQQFPNQFDAYLPLAQAHKSLGDLEFSAQTLQKLSELQPKYPMIHVMLSQALLEAAPSNQLAALDALAKAEKAAPSDAEIYYLRGKLLVSMGRPQEAADALERAIQLRPNSPSSYYQLGLAYQRLGKKEAAQEQFERKAHLEQSR